MWYTAVINLFSAVSARNLETEKDSIKTLIADISHQKTKTLVSNLLLDAPLLQEQPLPEESRACAATLESQAEKLRAAGGGTVSIHNTQNPLRLIPKAQGVLPLKPALARGF